jgi:hypothetical protein
LSFHEIKKGIGKLDFLSLLNHFFIGMKQFNAYLVILPKIELIIFSLREPQFFYFVFFLLRYRLKQLGALVPYPSAYKRLAAMLSATMALRTDFARASESFKFDTTSLILLGYPPILIFTPGKAFSISAIFLTYSFDSGLSF